MGGMAGIAAGKYLAPIPVPATPITSPAQGKAFAEELNQKSNRRLRLSTNIAGAAAGAAAGVLIGSRLAKRLAINYIGRKYGVTAEMAWQAIQHNLDLSKD